MSNTKWINRDAVTAAMLLDFDNKDLKNLFVHICGFSNREGFCYPSNATLADRCKCSVRSIIRWTKKLFKMGRLDKQFRHNRTNLFKVILDPIVSPRGCQVVTSSGDTLAHEKNSNRTFKTKNKQKPEPVCVKILNTEDQKQEKKFALNDQIKARPAEANQNQTILAEIKSTEPKAIEALQTALTLQEYLNMYNWQNGKSWLIKRAFARLSEDDKALIKILLPVYIKDTCWKSLNTQGKTYRCNPAKWLNEKRWTEIKLPKATKPKIEKPVKTQSEIEQDTKNEGLKEAELAKAKIYLKANYEELKRNYLAKWRLAEMGFSFNKETLDKWLLDMALEHIRKEH